MSNLRYLSTLVTAFALAPLTLHAAFQPGVNMTQNGWNGGGATSINAAVDANVVHWTSNTNDGTGAMRISNQAYNGQFGGWVHTPSLASSAGEPTSGAAADRATMTFYFKTASSTPDGSNIQINLADPVNGSDRSSNLSLTYGTGGLDIRLRAPYTAPPSGITMGTYAHSETNWAGNYWSVNDFASIASPTDWNKMTVVAYFNDSDYDYYSIYLNDVLLQFTGVTPLADASHINTYEIAQKNGSGYEQVSGLQFRSAISPSAVDGSFSNAGAQGFFFDDISMVLWDSSLASVSNDVLDPELAARVAESQEDFAYTAVPEPQTISFLLGGLAGLALVRRRR